MARDARWDALLELVGKHGRVEVEEAAAALAVSAATIRRDLDQLAEQHLLTRTRGGAVAHGVSYELALRYKAGRHAPEKQAIGRAVCGLVAVGEVVGLTGGTTVTEVARALAVRPDIVGETTVAGGQPTLTVVTNALNIASELAMRPQIKMVVTGGVARPQSYELTGPLAVGVMNEITLDVAVLGVNAIDIDRGGAYVHHEGEASVNRLLAERAQRVVVAADSSKIGKRAFARVCDLGLVDVLVTDSNVTAEARDRFGDAGVQVITV
ncbi:DeoR/GlpR family DNA-binding transcription regulator [Streptomyces sp. NPDC007346]|uniref:DeoR/GlpR family DNA-binding transcription regulator n=1 Tax=Streptomyces sp. NPDC007346 TaxID=3154682 RepID=UPI00345121D8